VIRDSSYGVYVFAQDNHASATLSHNLIVGNDIGIEGYAYVYYDYVLHMCFPFPTSVTIYSTNDTIAGNSTGVRSSYYYPCPADVLIHIRNDIIYDNMDDINLFMGGSVDYSDVGEGWPGTDNLSVDPMFWDPSSVDHGLMPGSQCIDASDPDPFYNDPDMSRNDMGFTGGNSVWFDGDYDGIPDLWEIYYGFNPADPSDAVLDLDGDGLDNRGEYMNFTDPFIGDTDNDGFGDLAETASCLDPYLPDTDFDGLVDGGVDGEDKNNDGVADPGETDPCNWDTDGDWLDDGWETYYSYCGIDPLTGDSLEDHDGDAIANSDEYYAYQTPTDGRLIIPGAVSILLLATLYQTWMETRCPILKNTAMAQTLATLTPKATACPTGGKSVMAWTHSLTTRAWTRTETGGAA
jgi:hypothetical protein